MRVEVLELVFTLSFDALCRAQNRAVLVSVRYLTAVVCAVAGGYTTVV